MLGQHLTLEVRKIWRLRRDRRGLLIRRLERLIGIALVLVGWLMVLGEYWRF